MQGNKHTVSKHIVGIGAIKHCLEGVVKSNLAGEFGSEQTPLNDLAEMADSCRP